MNVSAYRAGASWMLVDDSFSGSKVYPLDGKGGATTDDTLSLVKDNGGVVFGYVIVEQNATVEKFVNFREAAPDNDRLMPQTGILPTSDADKTVVGRYVSFGRNGINLPAFGVSVQANNGAIIVLYEAL